MIQSDTLRKLFNFLLFQAGWFCCVLFPGLVAAGITLLLLGAHFWLISQHRAIELQFIGVGTVLGGALDSLWLSTGVLAIGDGALGETAMGESGIQIVPVWLLGIWAIFMTTLSHSLAWMGQKAWLPFVLAPIAGPFAYWSASQLGAVHLPELTPSLLALAAGWLVVFPLLMHLKKSLYTELLT